ncbi:hypothetical protein Tsubulata_033104 [Turnera subulata]|uniref:Acyl-coenzyme A thioesterase 13 n=1 Tax=Turnera subulata TaxID=218843 RepID=A0A9Q0F3J5_9ROSI|nr:hypothetical protein Tsubulata_033104 [Turnera subulata]
MEVTATKKWLEDISKGWEHQMDAITLDGLKILDAQKGLLRCSFVVTDRVTDSDGNWHVGAIATSVDVIGLLAVYSYVNEARISSDFTISYYSSAKLHEEVEIEARVVGNRGLIASVVVDARRKSDGQLIASGLNHPLTRKSGHLSITKEAKNLVVGVVGYQWGQDANGNWHVGAMTTLLDDVGGAAVYSFVGQWCPSLDLCISFFSTAKIHEEVELEAKVIGNKGSITLVVIEAKKKINGELIALCKQWMAATNRTSNAVSNL